MSPDAHHFELIPPIGGNDHLLGPAHAAVAIIEFGDFQCPNCKQAAPVVKLMLKSFGDSVRFGYRHFPLEDVHPHALAAALAAECAAAQGRFWPMHDLLFERQPALETRRLHGYAELLELDMKRFNAEMGDAVYLRRIRDHQESGRASGVRATPTFYLNGRLLDVSFGLKVLFDEVEGALGARLGTENENVAPGPSLGSAHRRP